jgi:hypothetical protein
MAQAGEGAFEALEALLERILEEAALAAQAPGQA